MKLQQLAIAMAITAPDEPMVPAGDVIGNGARAFPSSLLDCYADIPLMLLLVISQLGGQPSGPPLVVGSSCGPPSIVSALYGGSHPSHWPDPEGFDVLPPLPSSL